MPTTVQPGVNEFVVTSAKRSGLQFARLAEGYTLDDLEADMKGADKNNLKALRHLEANTTLSGGGASFPDKPASFWVDLEPGSYVVLDFYGKTNAAKWVVLTVTGADTGATMPDNNTVKAVKDAKWSKKPKAIDRKGTLTFKNRSSENHFVVLVKMAKGATLADVEDFLMTEEGPPPVDFRKAVDSMVVSGGQSVAFQYKLPAGTYALMCFWPDASMGGMPHAAMGMIRTIKLK
ncbi:MAG TPA: hypothetical protein VEW73_04960 [Nocardioides sp.]|nr:hypothetical protein [Nocardioides sp.]